MSEKVTKVVFYSMKLKVSFLAELRQNEVFENIWGMDLKYCFPMMGEVTEIVLKIHQNLFLVLNQ